MTEKPSSQTVARKKHPFKREEEGGNLELDLVHKGGTFLLKASRAKKEKRRRIGQREDGGQRGEAHCKGPQQKSTSREMVDFVENKNPKDMFTNFSQN